jgi:very-short-patch-repair endonuclease
MKSEITPIEKQMFEALKPFIDRVPSPATLFTQYKLLSYRLDFALIAPFPTTNGDVHLLKLDIECDGHDFHEKTKWQVAHDKKRERDIQEIGWIVIRFSGSEIYANAFKCVDQIERIMKTEVGKCLV